ncbi:hypothetical protein COJ85_14660 [Bacillus sp. AFS076308]|uniref:hypothetical protein n=1 Tax=unclassified Bacillus (in: firmicutes) TaxID=185979 RepID=UPI000BFA292F|nr:MULTISPECIES: hypothetical protein [unclassified Bacillus (in: firmicutes)]PFO03331.1 hypothetical protein COJ85_14660 [Bacillus sp. AFS076308]PGV48579.1 hypothetical protein COD92_25450 [Bacillus sp. AFS037270]
MQLDYNQALRLEGKMIKYKNENNKWSIGRVAKVTKKGLEIEELSSSSSSNGYGYGFWGPGPCFRAPVFFPFVSINFFPFFFW